MYQKTFTIQRNRKTTMKNPTQGNHCHFNNYTVHVFLNKFSSSSGSVSLDSKPQFITEFGSDIPSLPTSSSSALDHVTKPHPSSSSSSRKKRQRSSRSSTSSTNSSRSDSSSPHRKKHSHHYSSSHHHTGDRDKSLLLLSLLFANYCIIIIFIILFFTFLERGGHHTVVAVVIIQDGVAQGAGQWSVSLH